MTKKEFEEELLDKLTLSFRRKLPEGGKIEFYANPKKFHEEVTEEKKAFWDETRAWISGNGPAPENTVIDYPDSIQAAMRDGLWEPELRDLALTLLKSISHMEFFKADRIGAKDLKEMGWDFERYLTGNLKQDTPDRRTTVPESFAKGAVKVFPEEAEAWTKETLKGEPIDTDSPYLRSIYCALNFLLLDSKKYAYFQEIIDRYVQDSYAGFLKDPAYKPKYYAIYDLIKDYRPASAEILKVLKQLTEEQKADMISKNSWGDICDELELPDFTYPLMIIREQAFPKIDGKYIPVAAFFTDMLKTNPERFIHTWEKLLEEKDPWLLQLLKIVHVSGAGKELAPRCEALVKGEGAAEAAFWTQMEKSSAAEPESPFLESLAAAADICPRLLALYKTIIEKERQQKIKDGKGYFSFVAYSYFCGREEKRYGEKASAILDEMVSGGLISAEEFFGVYNRYKKKDNSIPAETVDYAFGKYPADAEAYTLSAAKVLDKDDYLAWLNFTENKLRPLAYVPILGNTSKKVVDIAEKFICAAAPADSPALIEAVSEALPKLKKNGAVAAERILVKLKAAK